MIKILLIFGQSNTLTLWLKIFILGDIKLNNVIEIIHLNFILTQLGTQLVLNWNGSLFS